MWSPFAFDQWVLHHHEQFAHRFQRLTGIDCFSLARSVAIISLGSLMLCRCWILLGLMVVVLFTIIRDAEKKAKRCLEIGVQNLDRIHGWPMRIVFISMAPIALATNDSTGFILGLSLASLHYFIVCIPLPPGKSKIRQWFEAFKTKIQETLAPQPEPQPVPSRYSILR